MSCFKKYIIVGKINQKRKMVIKQNRNSTALLKIAQSWETLATNWMGIILVNGNDHSKNSGIEVVFCRFKLPKGIKQQNMY